MKFKIHETDFGFHGFLDFFRILDFGFPIHIQIQKPHFYWVRTSVGSFFVKKNKTKTPVMNATRGIIGE